MAQKLESRPWTPALIEARQASTDLAKGNPFLFDDYAFSEEEQNKVRELVFMLIDQSDKYPSWTSRAQRLDIPLQRINTWRQTRFYKACLKEASRIRALEGLAEALPKQISKATVDGSSVAFEKVAKVAGLMKDGVQPAGANAPAAGTAVFRIEDALALLISNRRGKVIEEGQAAKDR